MTIDKLNESSSRATAPGELDPATARQMLLDRFNGPTPVDATDLKHDDPVDVTIRNARVMHSERSWSEEAERVTVVSAGGLTYYLATEPGTVRISKAEPEVAEKPSAPVVSEDGQKILDGLNERLDERREPAAGMDWAMRQPEVASTDGPNAEGEYQVELLDFSVIEWQPDRKSWAVAVSDECDTSEVTR